MRATIAYITGEQNNSSMRVTVLTFPSASADITFPSAERDLLMFLASSNTAPSAPVLLTW